MKRRLIFLFLVVGFLHADQQYLLYPSGFWPFCEAGYWLDTPFCSSYTIDYQVLVDDDDPGTIGFVWRIQVSTKEGEPRFYYGFQAKTGSTTPIQLNDTGFLDNGNAKIHVEAIHE